MRLRPVSAVKVIKALNVLGFFGARQKGSHLTLKRSDGRITVVPIHPGEKIGIGLLLKIVKDADTTRENFLKLLEEV